jgi:prevent-host-death family protein
MTDVNFEEAEQHFYELVDRAAAGEEIVIARDGKPVAKLVPIEAPKGLPKLGLFEGMGTVPDDFDDPLPDDVLAAFEGRIPNS